MKNGLTKHKLRRILKAQRARRALKKQYTDEQWPGQQNFKEFMQKISESRELLSEMEDTPQWEEAQAEISAETGNMCRALSCESEAETRDDYQDKRDKRQANWETFQRKWEHSPNCGP